MVKISVPIEGGMYEVWACMCPDDDIFVMVQRVCPLECPYIMEDCSDVECPYKDEKEEQTLLDEWEPKMRECVRRVVNVIGEKDGTVCN